MRWVTDLPPNAKLREMQQNTHGRVQLIRAATPDVPNQTPMPHLSKQHRKVALKKRVVRVPVGTETTPSRARDGLGFSKGTSLALGPTSDQRRCSGFLVTQHGYITPSALEAQVWAQWLHQPCRLGGPHTGTKSELATSPLPSPGPHGGERSIWLHQACLLRVPMVGIDQYGYIAPTFLGFPWWGENKDEK